MTAAIITLQDYRREFARRSGVVGKTLLHEPGPLTHLSQEALVRSFQKSIYGEDTRKEVAAVAAALVGTFLGILISYGFLNPLCVNMTFVGNSEIAFFRTIANAVVGFANGMAPIMAIEVARRGLTSDVKPSADDLEAMLKQATAAPQG